MDRRLLARIDRAAGVEDLAGALERLAPTDLQSLLLEVFGRRARRLAPRDVLGHYRRSRFVRPAEADPRRLLELDRRALELLPSEYEPIELAPVAPLGAAAVLGSLSQDWALATARNSEVVSDSTNVLALECALRRGRDRTTPVKLAASHRLLRGQAYREGARQHFRLFALVAAGRGPAFALEALVEQLDYYRRLLGGARIVLTPLGGGLAAAARARLGDGAVLDETRTSGRAYYTDVCFKLYVGDEEVADGGFVPWTKALLADRRERLLISGLGCDRVSELLA